MTRAGLGIAATVVLFGCGGGDASGDAPAPDAEAGYPPAATVVGYGEGRWVAAVHLRGPFPEPGTVVMMASDDAVTWSETARFTEVDVLLGSAVYADGRFVVIGSDGTHPGITLVSPDGLTWSEVVSDARLVRMAGRDGLLVGASQNGVATSVDGVDWTEPVAGTEQVVWLAEVDLVGDRFFVYEGAYILESTDAVSWFVADTQLTTVASVGAIDGQVVAYGQYDCCYGEVPDGQTSYELRHLDDAWSLTEIDRSREWEAFLDLGPRVVAARDGMIAVSEDSGATWTDVHARRPFAGASISTDGAGTVVVWGDDPLAISRDGGATWTDLTFELSP